MYDAALEYFNAVISAKAGYFQLRLTPWRYHEFFAAGGGWEGAEFDLTMAGVEELKPEFKSCFDER